MKQQTVELLCGKAKVKVHCTSYSTFLELNAKEQNDVEKHAENNHFKQIWVA